MKSKFLLYYGTAVLFITGCSSSGRYEIKNDVAPKQPISVEHVENAQPQYEPYSRGGNKDYTVRGIRYKIIKNPHNYRAKGLASWYGKKFHGHRTSNGEIYDMYSMSAAHKTLPIPSYAKVTNLNNGKEVIVRINDRGPFHKGRIIDLSYAAAYKLGLLQTGTAPVLVEALTLQRATKHSIQDSNSIQRSTKTASKQQAPKQQALKQQTSKQQKQNRQLHYVIQVSSSKQLENTRTLSHNLSQKLSVTTYIDSLNGSHRVFVGPFSDYHQTQKALQKVKDLGYSSAFIRKQMLIHNR
jgi:rare lipoprotein A